MDPSVAKITICSCLFSVKLNWKYQTWSFILLAAFTSFKPKSKCDHSLGGSQGFSRVVMQFLSLADLLLPDVTWMRSYWSETAEKWMDDRGRSRPVIIGFSCSSSGTTSPSDHCRFFHETRWNKKEAYLASFEDKWTRWSITLYQNACFLFLLQSFSVFLLFGSWCSLQETWQHCSNTLLEGVGKTTSGIKSINTDI